MPPPAQPTDPYAGIGGAMGSAKFVVEGKRGSTDLGGRASPMEEVIAGRQSPVDALMSTLGYDDQEETRAAAPASPATALPQGAPVDGALSALTTTSVGSYTTQL